MIKCSSNTLRICKFIKTRNGIKKPCDNEEFHIVVESCSTKRYYSLNAKNCYCVELERLCNETYCVYEEECEGYDTSYEVDGCHVHKACVDFEEDDFHRISIINEECRKTGNLHIQKRVYDACGKEVCSDDCFKVRICGVNFDVVKTLNSANNFHVVLENLPFGSYEVKELDHNDYDVSYIVNGVEKERGIVSVDCDDAHVEVINRMNNGTHVLRICKWILRNGKLVKPSYDQCFEIVLRDHYAYKEYTLHCGNHFCITLEGDKYDEYVLEELDAENVIYEVDGVEVERVCVRMNEDHDVRIINVEDTPCPDPDPQPCPEPTGTLCIQKWMEEEGRLYRPHRSKVFCVRIQGYSHEVYELNDANDFTLCIDDINTGYYCVQEVSEQYQVMYEVNGVRQDDGYVFVEEGDNEVSIINQVCPMPQNNILHIKKRVDSNEPCEDIMVPQCGEFEIFVSGPDGMDYYTLSQENDYQLDLEVVNGEYMIYEVNPTSIVTYCLDGVEYMNEVVFMVEDSDHELIIINHLNRVNYVI